MKSILILFVIWGLCSCKCAKKQYEATKDKGLEELIGIVHINENECPQYIELSADLNPGVTLNFTKVYPINLKDGMKKKGLKVKFTYTLSKAMQPEGCNVDAVIQLNSIEVIP